MIQGYARFEVNSATVSPTTTPEMFVGIFKYTQINSQVHEYRCSTSLESIPEYWTQGNVYEITKSNLTRSSNKA